MIIILTMTSEPVMYSWREIHRRDGFCESKSATDVCVGLYSCSVSFAKCRLSQVQNSFAAILSSKFITKMSLKVASRLTCIAALSRDTSRIVRRAMVWVLTAREVVRYSTNSDRQSSSRKSIGRCILQHVSALWRQTGTINTRMGQFLHRKQTSLRRFPASRNKHLANTPYLY